MNGVEEVMENVLKTEAAVAAARIGMNTLVYISEISPWVAIIRKC